MYDLDALQADLAGTIFAGKLHFNSVTGSTNTDALAAARRGAPHGSVFFADEQTAGRGRGDHGWQSSAAQGLYVSVLLRPDIEPAHLPMIPLATGLAAAQAIAMTACLKVDIRWPNDLLMGDRKTGGILVESKTDSGRPIFVIVGIGINVHQQSFDGGLSTPATSVDIESGRAVSRQALLIALLKSLQKEMGGLCDPVVAALIPSRVAQMSSWISNRRVEVHGPQSCVGTTAGLDTNGFLLVRTDRGVVTVQTGGIRAVEAE